MSERMVCVKANGPWVEMVPTTVTTGWWLWKKTTSTHPQRPGPEKGDVVTVTGRKHDGFLWLLEWPEHAYDPYWFRPIDELSAALDRIEEESVTIEEPQYA